MTRRILQGGEDTWPGDGGTNRGEAFRVTLSSLTTFRGTGTHFDAVWTPTGLGSAQVMVSHIVGIIASGETVVGSSSSGLSASFNIAVTQAAGPAADFTLWGMNMPNGDWVYNGSNTGYTWVPPSPEGPALFTLDGVGARALAGTNEGGGTGVYATGQGLGSNTGGYIFFFPFAGYSLNPVDSLALVTVIGSPAGSTGVSVSASFTIYGWLQLF
jgi:hypothetical protein